MISLNAGPETQISGCEFFDTLASEDDDVWECDAPADMDFELSVEQVFHHLI
ncbi:MAG: hypothetical protein KF778_00080 [Rhodocyclaceae bacterium]|nr:hypothetical protein [Rhodocyclaceae bacterium]MBX3666777.1 hypothetical protein [Rhodocyclaceae bacterium]